MPIAPASLASLLNIGDTTASKAADASHADNFLALLNVGNDSSPSGNSNGNAASDSSGSGDANDNNQPDQQPQPQAAAVDTQNPVVTHHAPVQKLIADNAPRTPHSHVHSDKHASTADAQNTDSADTVQAAPVAQLKPDNKTGGTDDAQGDATDAAKAKQQLHSDIQGQLNNISQILLAIIQALSAGANTAQNPAPATDVSAIADASTGVPAQSAATGSADAAPSGAPVTNSSGILLDILAADVGGTLPQAAADTPVTSGTEVDLLKDIQSLLQKMQAALGNNDTQSGSPQQTSNVAATGTNNGLQALLSPAAQDQADNLQAIADALQSDVARLTQFIQQADSGTAAPVTPLLTQLAQQPVIANAATAPAATPGDDNAPSLATLGAQLKAGIAQVRGQLQKLKNDNEAIFAQAKTAFQSSLDASQLFKDALAAGGVSLKATVESAGNNNAITPAAPVVTPTVDALQNNMALPVAAITVAQGGTDTSSGDSNSGGNQQQAAPQAIGSAQASQPQSTNNVAGSAFAKALNQASQNPPILDQVTFQVKTAVADGSSKIRIQLDPADLGKLDIKVTVDANGKTGVVVTADNRNTLDLLQRDAQGLTRALNDAGLSTDSGSLSFNLRGGQPDSGQGQGGNNSQAALTYQKSQPDDEEDTNVSAITRSYVVNLAQGLDIKI